MYFNDGAAPQSPMDGSQNFDAREVCLFSFGLKHVREASIHAGI
jgi:hypothetical protein